MRAFERGRGHDVGYVPGARSREPDVPSRTPEQAAEADVARLRDDVSIVAKQVDVAIDRCASLPEWNEEKDKLTEKVQALRNRIQGRNLKALSEKTEKAAADYKEAETTLRAIEGRLAEPRQLRAVPPVAGEVAIEESVVARAVDLDELFLWAAQLPVRHREALKDRFAKPSTADHFVRELQNYLAAARVYFEFKDILDGKKLRREVRERVLAKRRAALDSRRDDPLHDHRGAEDDATGSREANPVEIAERGVAGASDPLPHVQTLQPLFGHHDLSKVKAQVGGPAAEAARALGAKAYTVGERVGFASAPDLQLAAHEAAHVIEQRAAVARKGAVDTGGSDPGEVLADAIADAAGRGEPVEAQLDHVTSTSRPVAAVHRKRDGEESARPRPTALGQFLNIHDAGLRNELVAYLRDARWPDPASDVRFAPGGERRFTMSLVGAVASKLTDAEALQRLVSPANLSERFRRYVDLKHANDARAFGIALAQLVQWAARDALIERVGPRYRMLWASRFEPPDADELCGAHPMDLLVARALTTEGVVDLREMPAADAQVATVPPVAQKGGHGTRKKRHPHDHGSNAKDAEAPTVTQLMAIERDIGTRLDAIRDQVARLGFADELREAYDARADRVALLADADEATRARYLPVLQFQHAQLITISRPLPQVVSRYWPLRGLPDFALTPQRRAERDELVQLLTTYVRAAATSHDKERSTAILRQIAIRERQAQRDQIDAAQVQAILDTRDVVENTPYQAPTGTAQGLDTVAQQRQAMLDGTAKGRSTYEQQKAIIIASEVSLRARMQAAEHALAQLRAAAIEVYGDEEGLSRAFPQLRPLPAVIQDVKDRLADVERQWNAAIVKHTPAVQERSDAPDDWAEWEGRRDALPVAQRAFAKIAGDQDLVDFLNTAAKDIRHQAIINAVVQLAAALLITLATGMGAAALGARAAAALATEGSGLAMRGIAIAADLATNVTINTAVQLAISRPTRRRIVDASGKEIEESDGAIVGSMLLENLLMDGFMRTLSRPLRKAQDALRAEARELSALPHLTPDERRVLSSFSFAGTQMSVELVGGMTTQWAAHQLVETARMKGEEISEPFALTVLQQGAAIGLGKFFHDQLSAWEAHRAALAKTRIGRSPGAKALFAARDAFYARAKALSESLSPDPAAMNELLHTNEALVQQERALVASLASQDVDAGSHGVATHVEAGPLPHGAPTLERPGTHHADAAGSSARTDAARAEPATVKASDTLDHVGARIAAAAGARYVGDGEFEIDAPSGTISIEVRRTSRRSRFHVEGNRAVIEIERGLAAHEFERAVVDRLKAIREQGQGHVAHGSRDRVASSEIESASRRKVTDAEGAIAVRRPHADGGGSGSDGHGSGGGHDDGGPHGPGKSQPSAGEHIDSRYLDTYREDAAHWQAKALDEDPRAAALRSDPEFRKWFGKWMSQPKRFDGNKPRYPEGIPDHVRKQLDLVVQKGNIDLLTRSFELADLIKQKFPGIPLDPSSPEWKANRRRLVAELGADGEERIERFEQAVLKRPGDISRMEMDRRLDSIVDRSDLDQLAARFPGAQVYITGSAAQDKPIANVTDIDLIIVVAENTPTAVRREFEKLVGRCRLGRGPEAAKYGSEPFEVDVKVMVQSEFAGWAMAGPGEPRGGKPRTPLVNVRIDKPGSGELPGTGATGVDLHNHVMGVLGTDYFIQKVGQGSAVNALENTWRAMHDTKHWKQGKAEVKPEIFAELERARLDIKRHRGDMPPEALEARARRALDRVLAASDRVAFDKTYDIRDILVQDYVDAGGESFENLATDTLTALHDQGVTYSEQSVSMKKLRNRLDPETMRRAHERAARQGKDTDLRFLAMLSTKDVLSAQDAHGTRLDQQDKAFGETLDQVKELLARGDVAGIDLAGPEAQEFTRRGMANFKALLDALAVAGKQRGRPLVLRPHVGEGYDSDHSGSHVETARRNLELLLTALDEAGYHNPESGVIVRFGHAAHATPKQIEHMKRLGIVVEANIGSNLATGSVANADQHPLLYNLYYGVETVLSTDAQGVMGTQLSIEYQRASALIAAFKSGETSLQIDGKIVRYADLSPEIKKRFDIETLKGWAKKYVDDVHAYDARDSARNKPSTPRP